MQSSYTVMTVVSKSEENLGEVTKYSTCAVGIRDESVGTGSRKRCTPVMSPAPTQDEKGAYHVQFLAVLCGPAKSI